MLDMNMRKEFEALGDRSAAETITLLRDSTDYSDRRLLADDLRIKFVFAAVDLYNSTDQLRSRLDLIKTGGREIRLLRHDWDKDKLREEAAIEKAARLKSLAADPSQEPPREAPREPGVTLENLEAAARELTKGVAEMKAELLKKLNGEKTGSEEDHTTQADTPGNMSAGDDRPPVDQPPHSQSHRADPRPEPDKGPRRRGSRRLA